MKTLVTKRYLIKTALIFALVLLYGCAGSDAKPKPQSETLTHNKKSKNTLYRLNIIAPAGAKIRILNIKPKYRKNIQLKAGKYLIEVTKPSYKMFKKWIRLNKDLSYKVTLHRVVSRKVKRVKEKDYFSYLTKLQWVNKNEKFSHYYDKTNNLIWALQNSYIDHIKRVKVKHLFKDSMIIKGSPWPKLYSVKYDTLIYSGNFRYRGKSLLFKKNNTITLYKASKTHSKKEKFAKLTSLRVNGITASWRVPKYEELRRYNPFKSYQKYFEVSWRTYKDIYFNLPILCTKKDKKGYYTNSAYAYKYSDRSRLYTAEPIDQAKRNIESDETLLALEYSQNFALLLPVRKPSNSYDKIIFNTKISLYERLHKLTNLLTKQELKREKRERADSKLVNKMASIALNMLLGDPKFAYAYYDASRDVIYAKLYASSANLTQKVTITVGSREPKKLKKDLLNNTLKQSVTLTFQEEKPLFKAVHIFK